MGKTTKRSQAAPVRATRITEQHDNVEVHEDEDTPWKRGASLDMPPARPNMDQRWIRAAVGDKPDASNWARKMREGWSPRKADTVPQSYAVPRIEHGKFDGYIGIEGMVLCERPVSMSKRRTKHFQQETARRTDAVNADLQRVNSRNRNPAFGPIAMASKSEVLRERQVKAADD